MKYLLSTAHGYDKSSPALMSALDSLSSLWQVSVGTIVSPASWFPVVTGPRARGTIADIYGTWPFRWIWASRSDRRSFPGIEGYKVSTSARPMRLPLPDDVVLISRGSRGLVAISRRSGRVLKLLSDEPGKRSIAREVSAHRQISRLEMRFPTPGLIDYGEGINGFAWICTELAANTMPLLVERVFPLGAWHRWRKAHLQEYLFALYKASNPEILSAGEWLSSLGSKLSLCPDAKLVPGLGVLLEEARAAAPAYATPSVVMATVHGDMKPEHIHRSRDGYALIDWGNSVRGAIAGDWFEYLVKLWLPRHSRRHLVVYLAWLASGKKGLPRAIEMIIGDFFSVQSAHFGFGVERKYWRFQMLMNTIAMQLKRVETLGFSPDRKKIRVLANNIGMVRRSKG